MEVSGDYPGLSSMEGDDTARTVIEDQILALIIKVERQGEQLLRLQKTVEKHTQDLAVKDNMIHKLRRELNRFTTNDEIHSKSSKEIHNDVTKTNLLNNGNGVIITKHGNGSYRDVLTRNKENPNRLNTNAAKVVSTATETLRMSEIRESSVNKRNKRVDSSLTGSDAFSVSLNTHTDVTPNRIIVFDDVMIDAGHGYNHGNGIYEVPATGVYVFTWSIRSGNNNGGNMITQLTVNGVVLSTTNADSDSRNWESATGLIVTSVSKGDHVYIKAYNAGQVISYNLNRSTFSGWRLF